MTTSLSPERFISREESARRVGIPTHERELTDAFLAEAERHLRPGVGRSVFVLEEPDLGGAGIPDLVFVTMAASAFEKFRRTGLRLSSPAAARALDPQIGANGLGVSASYERAVRRDLAEQGWGEVDIERLASMVTDTLAFEAKVRDWRRAIQQVSKFRRNFHRSAILMPERELPSESHRSLDFYGCGLLLRNESGFIWRRPPTIASPKVHSRLWMLELVLRGIESGSAYRLSDVRNRLSASR